VDKVFAWLLRKTGAMKLNKKEFGVAERGTPVLDLVGT